MKGVNLPDHDFDVALSFAGEDRAYVDQVARELRDRGVKVFYDLFEEAHLWGKDLYAHLSELYQRRARFTVMFISEAYASKLWTNHERKAAQARAFQEAQEYVLPARFDATEIPGVLPTVGYVSLVGRTAEDLASLITKKIVSAGGSIPTELVRRDFSSSTRQPRQPTDYHIRVTDDEGRPLHNCDVVLQADNGTIIMGKTREDGIASVTSQTQRRMTLMIAHPCFPAGLINHVDGNTKLDVVLPRTDNVGSVVIQSTGYIPALEGRLNPIKDTGDRTYLYADNIAVGGGLPQPASFTVGEPIELEDANGTIVFANIIRIEGRVALVQFTRRGGL